MMNLIWEKPRSHLEPNLDCSKIDRIVRFDLLQKLIKKHKEWAAQISKINYWWNLQILFKFLHSQLLISLHCNFHVDQS